MSDNRMPNSGDSAHEDSGKRCLAIHTNKQGRPLPPCVKCARCHQWVRPEAMVFTCYGAPGSTETPA